MGQSCLRDVVELAFHQTHVGRSADDVVIDEGLNAAFLASCHQAIPTATAAQLNWELLNLRKKGLGKVATTRRIDDHSDYIHAAEIAARHMEDKYQKTIDRVLCDPQTRKEFDQIAQG